MNSLVYIPLVDFSGRGGEIWSHMLHVDPDQKCQVISGRNNFLFKKYILQVRAISVMCFFPLCQPLLPIDKILLLFLCNPFLTPQIIWC